MVGFVLTRFVDLSAIETLALEDIIKCGICLQVLKRAVDTRCGHTFCHECLNQWLSRPQTTKECPECRQPLASRKRTRSQSTEDNSLVIGGNVFVDKNLRINAMIEKLKIRCDYEWNGCPEVCPLESLFTHLKTCQHRLCLTCGLSVGLVRDDHNCIEGLKRDRNEWTQRAKEFEIRLKESNEKTLNLEKKYNSQHNEWQMKCNEWIEITKQFETKTKEMDQKVKELETKLKKSEENSRNFEILYKQTDCLRQKWVQKYQDLEISVKTSAVVAKQVIPLAVIPKCLLFGRYETNVGSIEFKKYGIVFNIVSSVGRVCLPYNEIQCLMACVDPSLPMLCIKPNKGRAFLVDRTYCSVTEFINKCNFNVHSKDLSQQFIIIELRDVLSETFVSQLCAKCNDNVKSEHSLIASPAGQLKATNNKCEYKTIDLNAAQLMLKRLN
ncbi:unnamed protein product [Medioppia subpectinata]|uniref:RING-type domain-containing protein n=1 Tax=Medioppia subpectinata TaxID=1979941 RepID=A0A7R9Q652_9ACAR|nr:unnamed protein product [Medioppia subpectinata]CAG2114043.1 unnamed protein product [Medioppia subpectinata]